MRKLVVYLSIYALLGVVGWNAFSYLSGQRTLIDDAKEKISVLTATQGVDQTKVFRWQDAKGDWHYSDIKPSYEKDYNKFKTELEYLRTLPKGALPTGDLPQATEANSKTDLVGMIPGISQIQQGLQLAKDALDIQKMLDSRNEKVEELTKKEQ